MKLKYLSYNNLDIDKELFKISLAKEADVVIEPSNKNCLFILGVLFVYGIKINILNEKDLDLEQTQKSFSMIPYVWSKIGNSNFPKSDYSGVQTEMDCRIENVKRLGVSINKIVNNPLEN